MSGLPISLQHLEDDHASWPARLGDLGKIWRSAYANALPNNAKERLISGVARGEGWAFSLLCGLRYAASCGYQADDLVGHLAVLRGENGLRPVLVPVSWSRLDPWGDRTRAAEVLLAVGGVLAEQGHIVSFLQPVPPGADMSNLIQAIAIWKSDLRTGRSMSRSIRYDDEQLSVHLSLTNGRGLCGCFPAQIAGEEAEHLRRLLAAAQTNVESIFEDQPVIMSIYSTREVPPSPGHLHHMLYGSCRHNEVAKGKRRLAFERSTHGYLARRGKSVVSAWLLGMDDKTVAYNNPWNSLGAELGLVGRRLEAVPCRDPETMLMQWEEE